MASGYKSLHPLTEALLREIGIASKDVTNGGCEPGTGPAASATFHDFEGTYKTRQYSSCFDLRWSALDTTLRDKLVSAGVCVYPRDWSGNEHHHCVHVGLRDDEDRCRIRSGPRAQVVDFCATPPRNGLAGHAEWSDAWRPSAAERKAVRKQYEEWVPDVPTRVFVNGNEAQCYAWLEGDTVTAEVRKLCDALGARILEASVDGITVRRGSKVDAFGPGPGGPEVRDLWSIAGEFLRAPVRDIARGLGLKCTPMPADDGVSWKVYIAG